MKQIAPGVAWHRTLYANLYFVGEPGGPWAMVDAGPPGAFERLREAAEARFGADARPEALYLTHGHFDHVGSALALATYWDVPIYAHRRELPFLTGRSPYPPGDPTPGGAVAFLCRFFPSGQIDLGDRVRPLPEGDPVAGDSVAGDLPGLAGWEAVETPGHSPGHVCFFRASDRVLLAGDAFSTVDLDRARALVTQRRKIARPPVSLTCDWVGARRSLRKLAELGPRTVACGHGTPMSGPDIAQQLADFAEGFIAPRTGRYVSEPARTDENGIVDLPPPPPDPLPKVLAAVTIALLAGAALAVAAARRRKGTRT